MRNEYLKNLEKIEFVITNACTGRCKHCSEGEHTLKGERINAEISANVLRRVAAEYDIKTVTVFGGEPLMYPEVACRIIGAAREICIPKRQIITNGYFSKDSEKIAEVASKLAASGVNDLLLSVDAFHQETIPIEVVMEFAKAARERKIPIRLSPAWLVSEVDENPYNLKTRKIIRHFAKLDIPTGSGNVIFPEGNARKYLAEYFEDGAPQNPYTEDPCNVKCLSFLPNGDVLSGNIYDFDIMEILTDYTP